MNKSLFIGAMLALSMACLTSVNAAYDLTKLNYLTENYPPYNFAVNGQAQGMSVDILLAAMKQVDLDLDRDSVHVLPWTRAYRIALSEPNTVLFSTNRSPYREALFQWVGPIADSRIVLLAKKTSKINIESIDDLTTLKIGVLKDDIGEQSLKALVTQKLSLEYINNPNSLAKMLAKDRIDIWAYEENPARWFLKQNQLNQDDFEVVYRLFESQLYYAFNRNISPEAVALLQLGIDNLKCTKASSSMSLYDEILSRYSL